MHLPQRRDESADKHSEGPTPRLTPAWRSRGMMSLSAAVRRRLWMSEAGMSELLPALRATPVSLLGVERGPRRQASVLRACTEARSFSRKNTLVAARSREHG